ncbi:transposable element Tc1 transposase [Trichonephila clavipes]|nr:transposable element Tc1 transposase [Trichonephila clavipes]
MHHFKKKGEKYELNPPDKQKETYGACRKAGMKKTTSSPGTNWFKKTNSVEHKQISGRSRVFNEREERWIVRKVRINPRTTALKMTLQCKSRFRKSVNPKTVRNLLRKHKYHGRVPQR